MKVIICCMATSNPDFPVELRCTKCSMCYHCCMTSGCTNYTLTELETKKRIYSVYCEKINNVS